MQMHCVIETYLALAIILKMLWFIPPGHTEDQRDDGKRAQTRGVEAKGHELELWIQTIHQFFNHFFFPAFERKQLVSINMKEQKLRQEAQRRITVTEAQQRAR